MFSSVELRQKYLAFFKSKQHAVIPSASLIPENDPTVLFTTAGMHPLVPFLLGEKHPAGQRLTDCQKCLRTGDIEDVGDNRHLTFFEMLGNWSLGDYFKEEAIAWSFEFLTDKNWLALDPSRLYVTVFAGDDDAPFDAVSVTAWQTAFSGLGLSAELSRDGVWTEERVRIFALGKDDNWWGLPTGGPCGPCTEMFYDTAPERGFENKSHAQLVAEGRLIEIWNDVFMEFLKQPDGTLVKLAQKNVDTGMGLERTVTVLNGHKEVFEISEFQDIFALLSRLSGRAYTENEKAFRLIADHARAATFILGDRLGVVPSNVGQGYVLRRLIRRAVRYGRQLDLPAGFLAEVAGLVISQRADIYPELRERAEIIATELNKEETKFAKTLVNGLKQFNKLASVSGKDAFDLYQSYGFPLEMTLELAKEKNFKIDENEFAAEFKNHQELSRSGSDQKFKGGLADAGEETKKLHTATHLLQAALQKILGPHVAQKGSNITAERLRFDFSHPEKMTPEQLAAVEKLVNSWIAADYEVKCEELPYAEAKARGAMGLFADKYGEVVKVYTIGDVSCEMCGGPHANHTGELTGFKILKEEASSAGVRRIKAVLK